MYNVAQEPVNRVRGNVVKRNVEQRFEGGRHWAVYKKAYM